MHPGRRVAIHCPSGSQQKGALCIHLLLLCIHTPPPPSFRCPLYMLVLVTTHLLESWEPIRMTMMQMEERGWKYMENPVSQCSS